MLLFTQEILDGFRDNSITELEMIAHQDFEIFEFKINGVIKKTYSAPLPQEWSNKPADYVTYIDNKPYSKYPIFSEVSFNALKDVLLLNTSLIMFLANHCILSKAQYDYLNRIVQRNIVFSQMTNGVTLLHYSSMRGDIDVVQIYAWRAKDVSELEIKCQAQKTPIDYARENNHLIIQSFLEKQIKKLRALQTEASELTLDQISKPLSDTNKQYIFNSLRIFAGLNATVFTKKLFAAALDDMVFPSVFKTKLEPLQLAYQANKNSSAMKALLESAIQTYFDEEGSSLFKELLSGDFTPEDWNSNLMRQLAGDEIIITENPYVEATIQDGKIYWCINFGNQIYYRKPAYEPIISQAMLQNRSWHLTWKEFRTFKDAGKRTGTVAITEERFVSAMGPFLNNNVAFAKNIWQELRNIGILDNKLRLSHAWHPFSNKNLVISTVGEIDGKKAVPNTYQHISNVLQQIANNSAFQEIIADNLSIYRPARVSKIWYKTGLIKNNRDSLYVTRIWDVGMYRELQAHAVPDPQMPCVADHIPSRSQVKSVCEYEIQRYEREISLYLARNNYDLRAVPRDLENLYQWKNYWTNQLDGFKSDASSLWSIYITKKLDDTGDTTRTSKKAQESLSFYSSVKKHIDDLKKELKEGALTLTEFLQALGAFRYMYSRMCKRLSNINEQNFIHDISYSFFGPANKARERKEMDEFFIQEMRIFQT